MTFHVGETLTVGNMKVQVTDVTITQEYPALPSMTCNEWHYVSYNLAPKLTLTGYILEYESKLPELKPIRQKRQIDLE